MSRKHADLEREFIDELAKRTGRTLGEWMAAIDAEGIADRNAIIDWLRPQGLTFAHASWLERIHHNCGRPIYIGTAASPTQMAPAAVSQPPVSQSAYQPPAYQPKSAAPSRPSRPTIAREPIAAPAATARGTSDGEATAAVLARGKGLKPLADMVVREIGRAVPEATVAASGDLLVFSKTGQHTMGQHTMGHHTNAQQKSVPFACLQVGPKELRLGLALSGIDAARGWLPARIGGAPATISHMLALSDARQVDSALMQLVVVACGKIDPT